MLFPKGQTLVIPSFLPGQFCLVLSEGYKFRQQVQPARAQGGNQGFSDQSLGFRDRRAGFNAVFCLEQRPGFTPAAKQPTISNDYAANWDNMSAAIVEPGQPKEKQVTIPVPDQLGRSG